MASEIIEPLGLWLMDAALTFGVTRAAGFRWIGALRRAGGGSAVPSSPRAAGDATLPPFRGTVRTFPQASSHV